MPLSEISKRLKKILIIDDDDVDSYITKHVIDSISCADEIVLKSGTDDAIEYLKNNSCSSENKLPDIIFLDMKMPGKDGLDFLDDFHKLNERLNAKCKIVILTNHLTTECYNKFESEQDLIKYRILQKPLTIEAIRNIL